MTHPRFAFPLLLAALLVFTGCATLRDVNLDDILTAPLDEETVAAGLREALEVGTGRAVTSTSATDGFLANELIRIALPPDLQGAAGTLRDLGQGDHVDAFVVLMNRAAEQASALAVDPFVDAVGRMTLADAFSILDGPPDAATRFFRTQTEDDLRLRFRPVVSGTMRETGLYDDYEELLALYDILPIGDKPSLDLTRHITDRTLDGLFQMLAQEEGRIRSDPIARTTDLLRRVFGR
ncbi:DUF4197 domain-containing protein [bacterium]|nr:DUF4197 domain-containing protein [bacterium]